MNPIESDAYSTRLLTFRKLSQKIQSDPKMKLASSLLEEMVADAMKNAKFTLHVYQASIGLSQREEDISRLEDLFAYVTQCGYYIETRVLLNTDLKVLQEGIFIAWDRAMPSYRMMSPN